MYLVLDGQAHSRAKPALWYGSWLNRRTAYLPALQDAERMSVDEIRKVATSSDEEVAAVILLDQIPRNVFRGLEAHKVSSSSIAGLCTPQDQYREKVKGNEAVQSPESRVQAGSIRS